MNNGNEREKYLDSLRGIAYNTRKILKSNA